jgi:hypothetical protein
MFSVKEKSRAGNREKQVCSLLDLLLDGGDIVFRNVWLSPKFVALQSGDHSHLRRNLTSKMGKCLHGWKLADQLPVFYATFKNYSDQESPPLMPIVSRPVQSTTSHLMRLKSILILSYDLRLSFPMISSPPVFQLTFFMHSSTFPCMLYGPTIALSVILQL